MLPIVKSLALGAFTLLAMQYTIVDRDGKAVGSIVTDAPPASLRIIGITSAPPPSPAPERARTFSPDYSRALSVEQMTRAWQAEVERLMPQPVTGGG